MNGDRMLERLKEELAGDFTPVKALKEPWRKALWIFPISLLFMAITLAVFGLRPDYANLGLIAFWGFCFAQVLACYLAFTLSLEAVIPGRAKDPVVLAIIGLVALAIHFIASWFTFRISPNWAAPGQELQTGMACLSAITIFGVLALLFGFYWVRFCLPIRSGTAGILLGLGSGLAAEAAWRSHCPISSWDHVLPFHFGAILVVMAAGWIGGYLWTKKKSHR